MGFTFRRKVPIDATSWVNVSSAGVSMSKRIGRRVTVNSRGRVTVRLARGLSWRLFR